MARRITRSLTEELPSHGAWVRELARGLVRSEDEAEDIAQETALAALQAGDRIRGALRPWLAQVARNFARRGWRDSARRGMREHAVARTEAVPAADEAEERLEVQRTLIEELSRLDPALRLVLVRRYFDGWTAARIARETGDPAATVRWRLQRGLAELRSRLDRRAGADGTQWRLALLPLCARPSPLDALRAGLRSPAGLTAALIHGALTMKATTQLVLAGTVLTALGIGVWWRLEPAESSRPQPGESSASPVTVLMEPAFPADPLVEPEERTRGERAERAPERPHVAASITTQPASRARLEGRCVDTAQVPLNGVRVRLLDVEPGPSVESGAGGDFALELPEGTSACTLRLERTGFATRFVSAVAVPAAATSLGTLVLSPGGQVHGRVLGPGGRPFAGAEVTVTDPDLWGSLEDAHTSGPFGENLLGVLSDADGRFVVEGVELGSVRVWAGAPGMRFDVTEPVVVRTQDPGEALELRLEPLRLDERITGIVLSPAGEPVSGARLAILERHGSGSTSWFQEAGADGRFVLQAKKIATYDVRSEDPEERWAAIGRTRILPGTHDLELRFAPARPVRLRVRARAGEQAGDFTAVTRAEDDDTPLSRASGNVGGEAEILVPDVPFRVVIDARGYALAEAGPFLPREAPAALSIELQSEPGIRGRVRAGERPLPGARVTLYGTLPGTRIEHAGYLTLVSPEAVDETTADPEGRFTLKLRESGTYLVRAAMEGHASDDSGLLELDSRAGRDGLELNLGRGGALEGHVRARAGADPSGVIVALNRGDGFPRTVRSDGEGAFRFEGVTPGRWELARGAVDVGSEGGGTTISRAEVQAELELNCTIREGETTYQDLDLGDMEPCRVRGTLLVNGVVAAGWIVSAWPGAKDAMFGTPPTAALDSDGAFEVSIDEPGALRLSFTPPSELGGQGRFSILTEIRPGANEWQADLAMGRLSGRCLTFLAGDERALFYRSGAGVEPACLLPVQPDASGRYALPYVPAGAGAIQRLVVENGQQRWTTLVETEILVGRERVVDVP